MTDVNSEYKKIFENYGDFQFNRDFISCHYLLKLDQIETNLDSDNL